MVTKREVSLAFLQAGATVPGLMTGETSLSANKIPGLKIELIHTGLICNKDNIYFFIPMTNVKVCVLKHEENSAPKA
jgi:hypothetical protein